MMFSIRSFVLYAVGTSMCGGLLVLLCLCLLYTSDAADD